MTRDDRVIVGYLDDHKWSACFGLSLRDMYLRDAGTLQRIVRPGGGELRKMCGTGGIPEGRNEVARKFLDRTDGDWLFMVDTDMGFDPDTVDRLVASADKYRWPVVAGLCFALRPTSDGPFHSQVFGIIPTLYQYLEEDDEVGFAPVPEYPRDQMVKVAATGAACMLIHRRALNKVREKYGDCWYDPITHPTGLKGGPRTFSEDLSFCVRLGGVGLDVYVDTAVKTCHDKGGVFLTEEAFDAQQALVKFVADVEADQIPA